MERASFWWVVAPVTPNESKVMAVWRNGRKRRTACWSDSTVLANFFDLRETLDHAHMVALDIKDFVDHGGNKWGYGTKACLMKLRRNKCSSFTTAPSSSFSVPLCFAHIHQHRGLFINVTTSRQSDFKENVKRIWYFRISNGWGCFIWLLSLQVT